MKTEQSKWTWKNYWSVLHRLNFNCRRDCGCGHCIDEYIALYAFDDAGVYELPLDT